jgi:dihydrofolate reductase
MGKVIYELSMSLDGFITAANARPDAGLGDGGEKLHEWAFKSTDPRNQQIVAAASNTGATIAGRVTYDLSIAYWGADGPLGAVRLPTIIVSHSVPKDVPPGSVYTFVNSIEAAYQKAKELAGDKEISIAGSSVATGFLKHDFIDEIWLHVVPVVFGSGTPLFGDLGSKHISLETIEVIQTPEVTHLRYRVVK